MPFLLGVPGVPVLGVPGVLVLASQTFSSSLGQPPPRHRPRPRARLQRPLVAIHDLEVALMLALDVALALVHDLVASSSSSPLMPPPQSSSP
mmetsp:Transcript_55602/g.118263  ORF Transcript_55602/g.118263 Transcript_55602/m.118263 type:complete len:92 (-) Transcript_55602:740-1015(-)